MNRPLAIDLFAGLGGWTDGLLAEGYYVVGFDIVRHVYGDHRYPAQLVIQDVCTLHGSQFKDATLIVASPPCQAYSYRAMPWKRAKALPPPDNSLFDACFRIQREACEAAGRHIPLIVENVRGAQKWVGRARWSFGSFYLWGDVPALMPLTFKGVKGKPYETGNKNTGGSWFAIAHNTTSGRGQNPDGRKGVPHRTAGHWTNSAEHEGVKCGGQSGEQSGDGRDALGIGTASSGEATNGSPPLTNCPTTSGDAGDAVKASRTDGIKQRGSGAAWWDQALDDRRKEATAMMREDGTKIGGGRDGWFGDNHGPLRRHHSGSTSRKFASAMIAKIPLPLSRHIAATFYPR